MSEELKQDIIKHQTIDNMVHSYREASEKVENAFRLLEESNKQLESAFGEYSGFYHRESNEAIQRKIKINAWRSIIKQTGLLEVMTSKRRKEFEDQLERGDAPDITFDSVWNTLMNLRGNANTLLEEAIKETFEWLRPMNDIYKTNSEFEVGKKVILEYCIEYQKYSWGEMMNLYYRKEDNIRSLDNVFHLLDGKGVIKYPGDFLTKIKNALSHKQWKCETEYFRAKWFKKGTMHIELMRPDLVTELNRIAGSGSLKGER